MATFQTGARVVLPLCGEADLRTVLDVAHLLSSESEFCKDIFHPNHKPKKAGITDYHGILSFKGKRIVL